MAKGDITEEDRKHLERWIRDGGTLEPIDFEQAVEYARHMLVKTAFGSPRNRDLALVNALRALIAHADEAKRIQLELAGMIEQARTAVDLAQTKVTEHYLQRDDTALSVGVDFGKVRGILQRLETAVNTVNAVNATRNKKEV
jgi:formylmethanofuran dehydrogenase subunit B